MATDKKCQILVQLFLGIFSFLSRKAGISLPKNSGNRWYSPPHLGQGVLVLVIESWAELRLRTDVCRTKEKVQLIH